MRLGFVGTGTISAAIIEGLCKAGEEGALGEDLLIVVSPRNAEISAGLAARFSNVTVAASNQDVLDTSDIVFIGVRPQIVTEVLAELQFRPDHHVVSLVAAVSLDFLNDAVAPASTMTRAVPIPSVARRQGPTALFPPNATVKRLFDAVGTAIELDNEEDFDAFTGATATMGAYFRFTDTITTWMGDNGIAPDTARAFVGQMMVGLADNWTAEPEKSFAVLADEHQTRGGLNEQVVETLTERGVYAEVSAALDGIKERLIAARA